MEIKGSRVLIIGGWGLVGSAISRKIMESAPSKIIVTSLRKSEAEEARDDLIKEFPDVSPDVFEARWGNIFAREEWKDLDWNEVLSDKKTRERAIKDIFDPLDEDILSSSALYRLVTETKPDIVFDCVNTATAIAYQNVYSSTEKVKRELEKGEINEESVERMMASMYMPQLIRHVQIMQKALIDAKTTLYLKIGTSGTGGMGLNIPYTHSEERPSRTLLSKAAVAGAQTLLLFLMARTPGNPIVKEIKPTAAIAWKKIAYGEVLRKGKRIPLFDMKPEKALKLEGEFKLEETENVEETGEFYKSVYIDTGENGIFSKGEFQAIGSLNQMEIVTPEEIAAYAVYEAKGGNTGKDVIQGMDAFVLGPPYRGGSLHMRALARIKKLEKENGVDSVAFEMLGPPRLSKLLFEANIIKKVAGSPKKAIEMTAEEISKKAFEAIKNDDYLRKEVLSIGLPILLPDGESFLRGKTSIVPGPFDEDLTLNEKNADKWANDAWIDLRPKNFENWKRRFKNIMENARANRDPHWSSKIVHDEEYWDNFEDIDEGKLAAWIFEKEDDGWRWKR